MLAASLMRPVVAVRPVKPGGVRPVRALRPVRVRPVRVRPVRVRPVRVRPVRALQGQNFGYWFEFIGD